MGASFLKNRVQENDATALEKPRKYMKLSILLDIITLLEVGACYITQNNICAQNFDM